MSFIEICTEGQCSRIGWATLGVTCLHSLGSRCDGLGTEGTLWLHTSFLDVPLLGCHLRASFLPAEQARGPLNGSLSRAGEGSLPASLSSVTDCSGLRIRFDCLVYLLLIRRRIQLQNLWEAWFLICRNWGTCHPPGVRGRGGDDIVQSDSPALSVTQSQRGDVVNFLSKFGVLVVRGNC